MGTNASKVIEAFWKAMDKPAGYTKKSGWLKAGIRDTVVKGETGVCYLLWGHNIAELSKDVLILCDCGWQTNTTKDRLNGILRANDKLSNFSVGQDRKVWYLNYRVWSEKKQGFSVDKTFKWHSGAKIDLKDPFKHLVEIKHEAIAKKGNDRSKRVKNFLTMMKARIEDKTLAMDGGECWGIVMGMQECHECEFLAHGNCGGGLRLINKALTEKGYRQPAMFFCKPSEDGKTGIPDCEVMLKNWWHIEGALRTFINKRLAKQEYTLNHGRSEEVAVQG